jgi:hypothetical protein
MDFIECLAPLWFGVACVLVGGIIGYALAKIER